MPMLTPAEFVIRTFGGVRATARAVGRSQPSVSAWRRPKAKKGTGGSIPGALFIVILGIAKSRRMDIGASDLIHGRRVAKR